MYTTPARRPSAMDTLRELPRLSDFLDVDKTAERTAADREAARAARIPAREPRGRYGRRGMNTN